MLKWIIFIFVFISCSQQKSNLKEDASSKLSSSDVDCGLLYVKGTNWFFTSKLYSSDVVTMQKTNNLLVATRKEKCSDIKSDLLIGMTFSF
jgi:hypothetical protein